MSTDFAGDADQLRSDLLALTRSGPSSVLTARDPVNLPMINNWLEAMGDDNPVYVDDRAARAAGFPAAVAPPAMTMVWTMLGLHRRHAADDPFGGAMRRLEMSGFTSVVATNCAQRYHRYVVHGERLTVTRRLTAVSGLKRTALGDGWFLSTSEEWRAGSELVADMSFRVLKFAPGTSIPRPDPRPVLQPTAATGTPLPPLVVAASTTFVIAAALATRDFEDVHHDRDAAIRRGARGIFVNILTDLGLLQRYVTASAGPGARVRSLALRLAKPCYAGDTLELRGTGGRTEEHGTTSDGRTSTVSARTATALHFEGSAALTP